MESYNNNNNRNNYRPNKAYHNGVSNDYNYRGKQNNYVNKYNGYQQYKQNTHRNFYENNSNNYRNNYHSHPNNYYNYYNSNQQSNHSHPKNTSHHKQHEIISIKTERLIFQKKQAKQPIFYDPQSEIAQKCRNIDIKYQNGILDADERENLMHIQRCNVIRQHTNEMNVRNTVDSEDNPVTPPASDDESQSSEYDNNDNNADKQEINFGATKTTKMRNIWEYTNNQEIIDENGINLLSNDNDMEQYGIYNANGIKQQAMMVPNAVMIGGEYLLETAQIKCKSVKNKNKKKIKNKQSPKSKWKKTRRGRKKNRNNHALSKNEIDQQKARELVAYLDMIRNTTS